MASYDALINLKLSSQGLKDLKRIEGAVDKINKPVRTANTRSRVEEKLAKSTEARRVAMIETRRVGDLIQKGVDKGLKLSKARNAVDRSSLANQKGEFKVSKAQLKIALDELKIQTRTTDELRKQAAIRTNSIGRQMASPIGGTRTMMGSPSQLAFAGSGMGRSPLRGTRLQFGSPAFFENAAKIGGARSPLLGSKTTFGSPAFFENAAKTGGAASPLLGSKTTFGSPKFFEAGAKAGGARSPLLGNKDLVGSPKYYEAVNKDIKRIASQNVMPVEGFKHIPGSPAYLKDQAEQLNKLTTPKGDFSSLSDRQSRNVKGKRTFMNNRFARMGLPMPTKGFDAQSALISGAFPLLFGQGPVGAAAGAIGGGVGGMFGQMGGFAGGIAATALVQQIQQLIGSLGNLGKAMGPFVQDTNALIDSMGLAGTAEAKRIQIIEQLQGKQAAFNAAMQKMKETIGTEATKNLQQFGEKASLVGSEFKIAMTKMQAALIPLINAVDKFLGVSKGAAKAQRERFIENSKNASIVSRREELKSLRQNKDARGKVKDPKREAQLEKELEQIANIGIALENQRVKMSEITLEHDKLVQKTQEEKELKEAVKKLTETGMSQAIAKEVAQREQLRDKVLEEVDALADALRLERAKLGNTDTELQRLKEIDAVLADILKKRQEINGETDKAVRKITEEGGATEKIKVSRQEIADLLANETTNAIMGLIEGTKTLGEALAGIAKSLAKMFLNAAFQNIFNSMIVGSEQGSYSRAGGFKAFQYGGVVNQPTLGLMGEGGEPEYVIPASKMSGAMSRYSAGARGGAVIPGGSHESGTVAGGSGNAIVEYTGPVLNFNGDEYVPKSAVPEIIGAATKQGAMAGKAQVIGTLRNSRSQRASLGL